MKTKLILGLFIYLFIFITLVSLHNTHVLNYTRNKNNNKKITYQILENILILIFKVITKHRKLR